MIGLWGQKEMLLLLSFHKSETSFQVNAVEEFQMYLTTYFIIQTKKKFLYEQDIYVTQQTKFNLPLQVYILIFLSYIFANIYILAYL